jgi:hypothetical protein
MKDQLFCAPCSLSRKNDFIKRCWHILNVIIAVHFSVVRELIDDIETAEIPYSH